jgi:alpha-galactosidase
MRLQGISRREIMRLALASPLIPFLSRTGIGQGGRRRMLDQSSISRARAKVVLVEKDENSAKIKVLRNWKGPICHSEVTNHGNKPVRLKQVVLFELPLDLPATTKLYGEGFQMLSQTGGTLGQPVDLNSLTDAKHYKMPIPAGARAFYGLMTLSPAEQDNLLLAFSSCRRFSGQFYLRERLLQVVVDTEGLELKPGETWELEEFTFRAGADREQLLADLAERLKQNHPPLRLSSPPSGWCSWYCFGPRVTAQQVLDNLDFIAKHQPGLKYIQIDDGYQPAMGDWLETGAAFGGNVQGVLKQIRQRGFEPAIWVAPFVAEEKSHLFQQHPDWFVKDSDGKPLPSDRVTFGGWRRGPWYALDGTHPEAQQHFENLFRTMRQEWGCTYFKLDANFWGAMHGGHFHDPHATRIEAYRRGMQAILRGAQDSFILGCNHPIWASLGLVHGSRSSNDIKRTWERVSSTARQNLNRNWQNGRLWWNDPDVLVLTGDLSEDEFRFHATAVYASGGMLLSGDDLTKMSEEKLAMLRKMQPPAGVAARFSDSSLRVGTTTLANKSVVSVLNTEDRPQTISFQLPHRSKVIDFWSEERLGLYEGEFTVKGMPPHSGRLLICDRV